MPETLDNPVIKPDSNEEAELLALSQSADAERGIGEESDSAETQSSDTRAEQPELNATADGKPDNSEADPEKKDERPRDELGRFTKTEKGEDIPEAERKPAEAVKPQEQK